MQAGSKLNTIQMTLREKQMQRDIEKAIEQLAPLIAENGVGNILMAISGICSAEVLVSEKENRNLSDKFLAASKLITPIATEIQQMGI